MALHWYSILTAYLGLTEGTAPSMVPPGPITNDALQHPEVPKALKLNLVGGCSTPSSDRPWWIHAYPAPRSPLSLGPKWLLCSLQMWHCPSPGLRTHTHAPATGLRPTPSH